MSFIGSIGSEALTRLTRFDINVQQTRVKEMALYFFRSATVALKEVVVDEGMESAKKECMANIKSCEMGKCGISTIDFCQFLWYNNRVRDYTRRPRSERSEQTIARPCATLRSDIMAGGHGIMTERVLLFDEQWEEWAWGNSIQTIRYKLRCQKGTSAM